MDYTAQYSEWLSAYIDGELDASLEEPLFAALASNADLRQELRELLALRQAAHHDRAVLIPPMSATAAVFQSLGIGAGIGAGLSLLHKLWLPALSAIAGGVLTWLGVTARILWTPPQELPQQAALPPTSVPVVKPETTVVERIVYRTRTVYLPSPGGDRDVSAPFSSPSETAQAQLPSPLSPLAEASVVRHMPIPTIVRYIEPAPRLGNDVLAVESPSPPVLSPSELHPQFRLIVRGLGTTSLINVPQQPDRSSPFNTSAVGLLYTLSDHHAIGIEVGREPFAMQFYGYREDTRLRYEAYPALLWGTFAYQYRMRLSPQLEPFMQLGIGATEFGLLGRSSLGVLYRPTTAVGILLGVEGALMRYVYQATPYWTPNVGITYGIMFRF